MARSRTSSYAFTDPLGAAGMYDRPPTWLMRRAAAVGYGIGALTLGVTLLTPDTDTSDHLGIAVIGVLMAICAAVHALWRRPPSWWFLLGSPAGAVMISALVAIAKPLALIPIFYIWPLLLSGYFLQRREVLLNYALVGVGFGVVQIVWVAPVARLIEWVSVMVVGGVLAVLIVALKESLDGALGRLRLLATRDSLTGALNRRAFHEALDAAVARTARGDGTCAIAILDIDHFKRINDGHGHAIGDAALRHLVAVMEERTRLGDVLGRLGGEEFAVLLDGTDARGAEVYAEDLRAALARAARTDVPPFTVSVGVAEIEDGGGTAEGMLLAADRALYAAKAAGRDRVVRACARLG